MKIEFTAKEVGIRKTLGASVESIISVVVVMLTVGYTAIKTALMNPVKSLKSE